MKVGLQINRFNYPGGNAKIGEHAKDIAQAAEGAGFNSLWVMDHFFQIGQLGHYSEPMLEAYTTLGYLAGVTKKVTLGTLVTGVIYREPALLIKAVTTLDVISGGRAVFGIGAGWNEQEAKALGLLNPLEARRFTRLEDTLQLAIQMWSGDFKPFDGKIYHLPEPHMSPMPITKPHPPILIGGGGEEKTLKFVAQYANACNLFGRDMDMLAHKVAVLKQHCTDLGRNFDEIEKTVTAGRDVTLAGTDPDGTLQQARKFKQLGMDHIIYAVSADADAKTFAALAPVVDQISKM